MRPGSAPALTRRLTPQIIAQPQALVAVLDLGLAEWRLLHLPQRRFAVDDAGRVVVLTGAETPLLRKGNYRKPHNYPKR